MQAGDTPTPTDKYESLAPPSTQDLSYQLEQLVQQGVLTPEEAQAATVQSSDANNISTDPSLKKAQMDALSGLQNVSTQGLTDSDRANLNKISTDEQTQDRGAREAILQNADARGVGGSGLELLAQLKNQQDSATRQSQRDMDISGQAQDRALQALIAGGNMGGQIQSQDFNQQKSVADANDAISKFNATNSQQVNLANTQAKNSAQAANLGLKQDIANQNVATQNAQAAQKAQVAQQQYNNEIAKRSGQQAASNNTADIAGKDSQNQANATNKTIGTGLTAVAMLSDEREKKDIEKFDPSDFLDSLTGYKYEYKDKKHGAGKKVGVMAQDLEKSDVGSQFVKDSPDGKMVDYGKAAPAMMAALADLNKRVKGMEGKDA